MSKPNPIHILPLIVISQFAGTSLWFAGNAIISNLQFEFGLDDSSLGHLTSAVQLGFIAGTLIFTLFSFADRFKPSIVFFVCAVAGGIANSAIAFWADDFISILSFRFITGFFLAGIYPVGMKIASDWHQEGLGKALGYLVGALVLGTALPHLLKTVLSDYPWSYLLFSTSAFALFGGLLVLLFIPEGPYRKAAKKIDFKAFSKVFKYPQFRRAATGYFGHMWELYTFWAFIPVLLIGYQKLHPSTVINVPFFSFLIIAVGALSCVIGGYLSHRFGSDQVAFTALSISGICCILSPFAFLLPLTLFIVFLLIWGLSVIMDSPQFSTLVAFSAPKENIGTALTMVNGIGFALTIVSIQIINFMLPMMPVQFALGLLAVGPVIGLISTRRFIKSRSIEGI